MSNISLFIVAENGNRYEHTHLCDGESKQMVRAQTTLPVFFN